MTDADKFSAILDNNGTRWTADDGRHFTEILDDLGGDSDTRYVGTAMASRHLFPDGSAIVEYDGGWDIEGDEPWSWRGAQ